MAQIQLPLDRARFQTGMTWQNYLAQMGDNRARTEEYYQQCKLTDEESTFFKARHEPRYGLMIAENWCGDVHRNSPMLARIAESIPNFELRVFFRDKNLDLEDCFLNNGYRSIPVMVYFDKDWNELGRWIERPSRATVVGATVRARTVDAATPDQREAATMEYRKQMAAAYEGPEGLWRDTVRENRLVLETRLGLLPKPA